MAVKAARVTELELPRSALEKARSGLARVQRDALEQAAARIRNFHVRQRAKSWQFTEADGTTLGQRVTPIGRAGLYVPGGKAAYPSSVLMNALPAKVAGVAELIVTVPTPSGERNPLVLAAAAIAGVDPRFHDRRRASDRSARVRHADHPGGGQDRRPGVTLMWRRRSAAFSAPWVST